MSCNIEQYKECIKLCRKAKVPLMAWGPAGVGKTRGSEQAAKEEEIDFILLQGSLLNPPDVLGLPERNGNKTIWLRPDIFPDENNKKEGIILVDELPDAVPTMQKGFYQLILENKVQSHVIDKSWWIMGAGNRVEDKSFSRPMPAPLITRFTHVGVCCETPDFKKETLPKENVRMDVDDFLSYAVKHFHPFIVTFLKLRPEFVYHHQAVPRTWENSSKLTNATDNYFSFAYKTLIKGTVGVEIGTEFCNIIKLIDKMPSIDAILLEPDNNPIPAEKDILYAVTSALLSRLKHDKYITNCIKYMLRLPREYQSFFFTLAKKVNHKIVATKEYTNWFNKNQV